MPVDRHVPLDRRFTELGDEKQIEDAAVRSVLDRWRRGGSGVAWLFLDSVDESKLAQPNDFERALRSVRAWLSSEAGRARSFSARASASGAR
jgi:hypothetical protein